MRVFANGSEANSCADLANQPGLLDVNSTSCLVALTFAEQNFAEFTFIGEFTLIGESESVRRPIWSKFTHRIRLGETMTRMTSRLQKRQGSFVLCL